MKQINQYEEVTSLQEGDWLLTQPANGGLYNKISKGNLLQGLSGGASALWTPAEIYISLWLDGSNDASITKNASNLISQWNDISGHNRNFLATGTARPSINNGILNFNGTSNFIRSNLSTSFNSGANVNLFFVARYANSQRLGLFDSAPGQPNAIRNYAGSASSFNRIEWWNQSPILAIDCAINELEILQFVYELSPTRIIRKYVNGGQYGDNTNSSTSPAAWGQLTLGSINSSEYFFNGSIAEVIIVPSGVSIAVRQKIEGYLAHKWGLTGKLIANHPYKNQAPQV